MNRKDNRVNVLLEHRLLVMGAICARLKTLTLSMKAALISPQKSLLGIFRNPRNRARPPRVGSPASA
jgi:hypothetical protein